MQPTTARTWDSYEEALILVLNYHLPRSCFEWGAGKSTSTICNHPSVDTLESVEHSPKWADRVRNTSHKLNLIYESDKDLYPLVQGRFDKYDLIFIDGWQREKCIISALDLMHKDGVVIVHDANRPEYQKAFEEYKYNFRMDDGNTIILINDDLTCTTINKGITAQWLK